jgi:hypothetical protein
MALFSSFEAVYEKMTDFPSYDKLQPLGKLSSLKKNFEVLRDQHLLFLQQPMSVKIGKDPNTKWSRRVGLNHRPADYESAALPLSYAGIIWKDNYH